MSAITTTLFELYKIGPGPSSSHTLGPMRAGRDFLDRLAALPPETLRAGARVQVILYGSLAATGFGHGTHKAIAAGLMGQRPEDCPPDYLDGLLATPDATYALEVKGARLILRGMDIHADPLRRDLPFQNTLRIRMVDAAGQELYAMEYYSVGGGFLQWQGWEPEARPEPPHPYCTWNELRDRLQATGLSLPELLLQNEEALTGLSRRRVRAELRRILTVMLDAVERGLTTEGVLPGPIGVARKARSIMSHGKRLRTGPDAFLSELTASAFAVAEENAAGHVIVTAPTAGSSGVLPAIATVALHQGASQDQLCDGLLAGAVVGFLAKHNASIAGAEVGCQGEIGVGSAMAAAMLAQIKGEDHRVVENAAEIALEHHLGMTCDPVAGYVQIPCIERNAMGAVKAYTAYLIASDEHPDHHKVGLDAAIAAMAETGREMSVKFKETAQGGLAQTIISC